VFLPDQSCHWIETNIFVFAKICSRKLTNMTEIFAKVFAKSKWKTPNEKEGVIIHPDGKINVMIHQMIAPNEKKNIIIQLYENSELSSSQMIMCTLLPSHIISMTMVMSSLARS
jgi:hypothetical protein